MAEYVSISANKTYTFKTEKTITMPEGVESQVGMFTAPCIKATIGEVESAITLSPQRTFSASAFAFSTSGGSSFATFANIYTTMKGYVGECAQKESCTIDGITYWGYKSSNYRYVRWTNGTALPQVTIPQFTVTCVMYIAASGTVETKVYEASAKTIAEQPKPSGNSSSVYNYTYNDIYITIPKETNDIILALSVEYAE